MQDREDLGADRIVLFLPLVKEMTDVEHDQAFDVRLQLQLGLQAPQARDEDVRVALRDQLLQRALMAPPATGRFPSRSAIDAQIGRRALPQAASLELAAHDR